MSKKRKIAIEWTAKKLKATKNRLQQFFDENDVYSGESVVQCDWSNLDSVDAMADIANILFSDIKIDDD